MASIVGRALIAALLVSASSAHADRYFTWIDEQGQLRSTVIKEENPLEDRAEEVREHEADPSKPEQVSREPQAPAPATPGQGASEEAVSAREPVQAPAPAAPETQPQQAQGPADPVFNLDNFPDAEALEREGYLREGDPSPFYTWTDATGTVQNTPFNPGKERSLAAQKQEADMNRALTEELSRAVTLRANAGLPAGAAPDAAAVLGLQGQGDQPALLDEFARTCCQAVDRASIHTLDPERGSSLRIGADAPEFDFATGRSPYRVVELPESTRPLPLRLRSFVDGGVFLPTLVFLDANWQPIRLVTDIEFSYQPESWYRYGYLQARLSIEPQQKERWMLVLSRREDLKAPALMAGVDDRRVSLRTSDSGELELLIDQGSTD